MRLALSLRDSNGLRDVQIVEFAQRGEYENLMAAIAVRANLRYEVVENLMHPQRAAGMILVCKATGVSWATAEAVLQLARKRNGLGEDEIERARGEFLELSRSAAERIVRFWQLRQSIIS